MNIQKTEYLFFLRPATNVGVLDNVSTNGTDVPEYRRGASNMATTTTIDGLEKGGRSNVEAEVQCKDSSTKCGVAVVFGLWQFQNAEMADRHRKMCGVIDPSVVGEQG